MTYLVRDGLLHPSWRSNWLESRDHHHSCSWFSCPAAEFVVRVGHYADGKLGARVVEGRRAG